jgi:Ribbon-helix-helix protein, copG family
MTRKRPPPPAQAKGARFGVYLDLETRKALLHAAIEEGRSATQLVEDLIKAYLAQRAKAGRR